MIAQIYKCRWQVELFFRWIKQHLRIKAFYGTSDNAVKTQIWIAVSVYVSGGDHPQAPRAGAESLPNSTDSQHHPVLRKMPISCVLEAFDSHSELLDNPNQLILFEF